MVTSIYLFVGVVVWVIATVIIILKIRPDDINKPEEYIGLGFSGAIVGVFWPIVLAVICVLCACWVMGFVIKSAIRRIG